MQKDINSRTARKEIGKLINHANMAQVCMLRTQNDKNSNWDFWAYEQAKAVIELVEIYGIPHSTYDLALKAIESGKLKETT
tara:strand:- start:54 stop:296 length:243 start_codon:yes stop_codon:yes gene_type:complete